MEGKLEEDQVSGQCSGPGAVRRLRERERRGGAELTGPKAGCVGAGPAELILSSGPGGQ